MKKDEDGLTIYGVSEKDQGYYTCVASTELDRDTARAHLTVLGNFIFLSSLPNLWILAMKLTLFNLFQ